MMHRLLCRYGTNMPCFDRCHLAHLIMCCNQTHTVRHCFQRLMVLSETCPCDTTFANYKLPECGPTPQSMSTILPNGMYDKHQQVRTHLLSLGCCSPPRTHPLTPLFGVLLSRNFSGPAILSRPLLVPALAPVTLVTFRYLHCTERAEAGER